MPEAVKRPDGYILGFDYGQRRTGVAVGQALTGTATALGVLAGGDRPDWDGITRLVSEWKPVAFVVGLPLSIDGEETEMSGLARNFGRKLAQRYGKDVYYQDERLTSVDAQQAFAGLRASGAARKKHASRLDAVAAKIIVENWLQDD